MLTGIYIGTSGWSYPHWRKIFYPDDLKPTEYLSWYAKTFKVTEINTSFYHLPAAKTVKTWTETVPNGFRFCPKISRYITHMKRLLEPESTLPKFFDVFDQIQKKLGPVLIQLPPNMHFDKDRLENFLATLTGTYKGYKFALEARHDSWMNDAATNILKRYKIAWVISYSGNRWPGAEIVTARHVYIRYHGPDGSFGTGYTSQQLNSFAEKIKKWKQQGHQIWAFFNNDGHGYAVKNASSLISLLK
ncbi:DUF72 domain-containing protein [Chitinophaga silvatica]|uniref:DUF72 domain-containing protein n=1 Tax=Chitinophaga silvatica TaxID=2282649 RepID=A0A3E1Y4V7_9BACT|nr:DUF72 domain-containing protein [Chitinophaga silvatica]RFS19693.1 DUF72 domain-containing protein [Chitinophaga silvatica]